MYFIGYCFETLPKLVFVFAWHWANSLPLAVCLLKRFENLRGGTAGQHILQRFTQGDLLREVVLVINLDEVVGHSQVVEEIIDVVVVVCPYVACISFWDEAGVIPALTQSFECFVFILGTAFHHRQTFDLLDDIKFGGQVCAEFRLQLAVMFAQLISISAVGGVELLAQWLIVVEIDAVAAFFDEGCFCRITLCIELL